jgi:hypothetical protein
LTGYGKNCSPPSPQPEPSEYDALVKAVTEAHPGPWEQRDGYGDGGGRYTSIVDANGRDVLDGETGHLSDAAFNLLLNFPEMVKDALPCS